MIDKTEQEIMSTWLGNDDIPLLTIRSVTYNQVNYISDALDGFLSQITSFRFEVIIHDDASTDGTSDIIRSYAEKYPNIIVPIIQKENQYSKHNGGIRKAIAPYIRGKYIALCEGDDYWTNPYKLERQIAYMEAHPECSMTFHSVNYEQNCKIIKNDRITKNETDISCEMIIRGGGKYIATPSICCKTSEFMKYPEFRLKADVGDYPLQILLATLGSVHYFPDIWGVYRVSSIGSWSEKQQKSKDSQIKHLNNQIEWLSEFNTYSNLKYDYVVKEEIATCMLRLYKIGAKSFSETSRYCLALKPSKMKYIYLLSIIKNIRKNRKNSVRSL